MRGELASAQRDLEASRSIRGELTTELANAITDLRLAEERLEAEQVRANGLIKQIEEKEQAIANLQKELEEKEQAISTLQAQSQQQLQLTLPFITDSLDPAVTSQESEVISHQPSVPSEELPVTSQESEVSNQEREVSRGELIEYIRQRFPKAKINPQNITDAINGKSKRMPEFESTYGFKYVGKKAGQQHRFIILSQG